MAEISIEDMKARTFVLRQKTQSIRDEFVNKSRRWVTEHPMPSFWRWRARTKWEKKYDEFEEKEYWGHPILKELEELQSRCPHIFTNWQQSAITESRTCIICGYINAREYYGAPM